MNDLRRKRNMNGKKKAVIIPVKNGKKIGWSIWSRTLIKMLVTEEE